MHPLNGINSFWILNLFLVDSKMPLEPTQEKQENSIALTGTRLTQARNILSVTWKIIRANQQCPNVTKIFFMFHVPLIFYSIKKRIKSFICLSFLPVYLLTNKKTASLSIHRRSINIHSFYFISNPKIALTTWLA